MKFCLVIQSIKLKMVLCNSKDEAGLESYGVGVMDPVLLGPAIPLYALLAAGCPQDGWHVAINYPLRLLQKEEELPSIYSGSTAEAARKRRQVFAKL
jgi:hypothetical protein